MECCKKEFNGCCCDCVHQLELMCHPMNKIIGKGSMSTNLGYVCNTQFEDDSNKGKVVFFETKHGFCEYYKLNKL